MKIDRGQIYYVPFPFEDDPLLIKNRPAVVLSVDQENQCFLAARITKHRERVYDIYDYALKDWKASGLEHPSTIRCDKVKIFLFSAIDRRVGNSGFIGTLTPDDYSVVNHKFNSYNQSVQHIIRQKPEVTERYNQDNYASISKNGFFQRFSNSDLIASMKNENINFCYLKTGNVYKCVIDKSDISRVMELIHQLPPPNFLKR